MIFTSSHPIVSNHTIEVIGGLSHVVGDPSGLRFALGSMVTIRSWGSEPFSSMEFMFEDCEVTLCGESPVFAPRCSLKGMFRSCSRFNEDISGWNTSNVTNMRSMFMYCGSFNQNLPWDTSNVINMSHMFFGCTSFNQNLHWDTSRVAVMSHMFFGCTRFNQNLVWDTSKVTTMREMLLGCSRFNQNLRWDTSNVTDMGHMFRGCTSFDQNLRWNVSRVANMREMFSGCSSFNQPLRWDTSNVTDMGYRGDMFGGCTALIVRPLFDTSRVELHIFEIVQFEDTSSDDDH